MLSVDWSALSAGRPDADQLLQGKDFVGFARESVAEAKKVVWPTRKETIQITAVVFAFCVGAGIVHVGC